MAVKCYVANEQARRVFARAFRGDAVSINGMPGGLATVEVDPADIAGSLRVVRYNDSYCESFGYTRDAFDRLMRQGGNHIITGEGFEEALRSLARMCDFPDEPNECTVHFTDRSGHKRYFMLRGRVTGARGNTRVINVVLVDVTARMQAQERLRQSEELFRIASSLEGRSVVLYDVKADACRVESNTLAKARYGDVITGMPQALLERGIVARESYEDAVRLFERIRAGENDIRAMLCMCVSPEERRWYHCTATVVFDREQRPSQAAMVFYDATEQREKEAVYRKWKDSIASRDDAAYTLFRANLSKDAGLDTVTGTLLDVRYDRSAMTFNDRTLIYANAYVHPDDRDAYINRLHSDLLLAAFYRGNRSFTHEYRDVSRGVVRWIRLTCEMVEYMNSTDVQAFLLYENIDEQKMEEARAKALAETDPLTGALNRATFCTRVEERIAQSAPDMQHALIILDIDGFKALNDALGHAAGDDVLVDIAGAIRSVLGANDLLCRMGGDEFYVWLDHVVYDVIIENKVKHFCDISRRSYASGIQISASIGIARYPADGDAYNLLCRKADRALYQVKNNGKDNYAFYDDGVMNASALPDAQPGPAFGRAASGTGKRRMLVVDDNQTELNNLKEIFDDEYAVETARNGMEALIRLRHFGSAVSVVLLDMAMPVMDGCAVLGRMQNNVEMRVIPVIAMGEGDERSTTLKALVSGAADCVMKPIDADIARLRVRTAVIKAENERLRAQNNYYQLQSSEEAKYRTVLESSGTVVVLYDWHNRVFHYDANITEHIAGTYDNRKLWEIFMSDMVTDMKSVQLMQTTVFRLANDRERGRETINVLLRTPKQEMHWFRMRIFKRTDEYKLTEKFIITFKDVNDEVLADKRLRYQAERDELTGLYNRTFFFRKAEEMIALHEPGYYVMACFDINDFKVINDQHGSDMGDRVLKTIADTFQKGMDEIGGIVCRVTADNFALMYPKQYTDSPQIQALHSAADIGEDTIRAIDFSVGRYVVEDVSLSVSAMYDRANIARSTVKGRYDKHIALYDEKMRISILRRQEIVSDMNHALRSGEFEVWLQPQYNHKTGTLVGAEALVRWRHPQKGLIPPNDFIPLFERNGFIYELDKFVWEQCCRLLRKRMLDGCDPLSISVNISRYDVFCPDMASVLEGLVEQYGVQPHMLRLEITESAFVQSTEQIIRVVKELIAYGFSVEIDDFGSGYSSLNTLKDVPAQVIKLDMRFLSENENTPRGRNILASIVRMAQRIGMAVIAEGVETREQADYLSSVGCHYVQGYLYARPMPVVDFDHFSKQFAIGAYAPDAGEPSA